MDLVTQIHESHHNSNQIPEPSTEDETNLRSETEGIVDGGVGCIERESKDWYIILETITCAELRRDC